jgi:hypothetical protein
LENTIVVLQQEGPPKEAEVVKPMDPVTAVPSPPTSRIDWIDGFKGIACTIVFFAHYADNTFAEFRPDIAQWGTAHQFIRSGSFALNLFYLLSARVLVIGFLKNRGGELKWTSLGSSFFRRIFRFAIPTAFTLLFQYFACIIDVFGYIPQAKIILQNELINKPGWCELTSPYDQYKLLIQMFSDSDHIKKLYYSSTMWTIYDQYWGSVFVYGLAILVARMNNWRFAIYAIVAIGCSISQTPNLIFLVGFIISDLDTAGLIRKFEKLPYYIVFGFELLVAVMVLFFMSGGKIIERFDQTYHTIVLRNGVPGTFFDDWPNLVWKANHRCDFLFFLFPVVY